jgi:hypothetical protein
MRGVTELFTYGPGIPRYLALWLPLAPVLVGGLVLLRVRRGAIAVVLASTLPSFALHQPPGGVPLPVVALPVAAVVGVVGWWVAGRLTRERDAAGPRRTGDWAVLGVVALALALRVPLAWADPGIGDFATASELAAQHLLEGRNPYLEPNPYASVGTYQYPVGTIAAFVPFIAVLPGQIAGEPHLRARAAAWAVDAGAIVLLSTVAPAAAFAYAVHPTLVRESGIVVANDVLLGVLVAGAAVALARRRPLLAGLAVGAAISVKPAALVLVPLLLAAAGWRPALAAAGMPAVLQAPFLLLPRPGLHGLAAIAEPVARMEGAPLALSLWSPLTLLTQPTAGLLRALSALGVLAAVAVAVAAGRRLHAAPLTLQRAAAAVTLPLLTAFALATRWPTNFQSWYLVPLVVLVGLQGPVRRPRELRLDPDPLTFHSDTSSLTS